MEIDFYVSPERLEECKTFIRTLPSARFKQNPFKVGSNFNISLSMNVEDGNKLNTLFEKWHEEDKPVIKPKGFFKKLFS